MWFCPFVCVEQTHVSPRPSPSTMHRVLSTTFNNIFDCSFPFFHFLSAAFLGCEHPWKWWSTSYWFQHQTKMMISHSSSEIWDFHIFAHILCCDLLRHKKKPKECSTSAFDIFWFQLSFLNVRSTSKARSVDLRFSIDAFLESRDNIAAAAYFPKNSTLFRCSIWIDFDLFVFRSFVRSTKFSLVFPLCFHLECSFVRAQEWR